MEPDSSAQAKLRAVFELSPVVMCITGVEDGRLRDVNEAFLRLTGYTREEVLGRTTLELGVWMDPGQRERGRALLRTGTPIRDMTARF
jgi:two-component system, cell cycle sensor histidine kinase and response regulator CckA